ncbi:MAG: phosphatidate cytidylyltransferase [Sedimentisphaerales bacterium]|nr:phosphatidate cytidylyltransferase [Sedimentisphaerales bacterium]
MLRYRLIFGTLMVVLFVGLILLDGYLDGSLTLQIPDKTPQGTILCVLVALLALPAMWEMKGLVKTTGACLWLPVAIPAAVLLATSWYWAQFSSSSGRFLSLHLAGVLAGTLLLLFLFQARRYGTRGTILNCGANYFSIIYLGLFSSFVLAIRIEYGPWFLLLFIFTVKSSDTGAYAIGRWLGKHPFSPSISPKKTWEGVMGGIFFAVVTAILFSVFCGIMDWWLSILFGMLFALLGQLGDLAESMIKRDAQQKDSAGHVPGFGGVLDVIDSPLATAPLAYLFFAVFCR